MNKLPESSCWNCGKRLNAASHLEEDVKPQKGDVSICFDCGEILEFDETLQAVKPDEIMYKVYAEMDSVKQVREMIHQFKGPLH